MTFLVSIIRGDEAHKKRRTPEFIAQWQSLAASTQHVTVFQEPAFVNCWYQQYAPDYEPVLVTAHDTDLKLVGLLPLALEKSSNNLTHAAAQQVEYSGWLCDPAYKNTFISKAVATVHNKIPYASWRWSHIPPHAEVDWLLTPAAELKSLHLTYEQVASPILDLQQEEKINKIKKSKSVKSKINRLKRKGDLRLERITDRQRATDVMALIPDLVNFRHGAAHGDLAFREDRLQHGFYQSRADNLSENHFSALWMGETLLAFHFGGIDSNTIYIGLTAFDPRESKHSPGVIFILHLAGMMSKQGIRYIDLTPGGDEYKERFCNAYHTLYRPVVHAKRREKYINTGKQAAKAKILGALSSFGINKDNVVKSLKTKKTATPRYKPYKLSTENYPVSKTEQSTTCTLRKQQYSDLLVHQHYSSSLELQALLNDATQRFSKEETLLTLTEKNKLIAHAWISKAGANYRNHDLEHALDEDQVIIDCVDVDNALPAADILQTILKFAIAHVIETGVKNAFCYIPESADQESTKTLKKLGFTV